jgi:hypothetical protein
VIEQGIYATNTEAIRNPPQVRDGMCGAPLVLLGSDSGDSQDIGGIGGFLCYSDIKGYATSLLCYAEPPDLLIANGWSLRGSALQGITPPPLLTTLPIKSTIGGLRRPFLSWISEFPTHRISMSINHWHPQPALNPETSKKE